MDHFSGVRSVRFDGLPPGHYEIQIEHLGIRRGPITTLDVVAGSNQQQAIVLQAEHKNK